ncbi:hypothetical protein [Anaeromyxobacter sp. K]|uniref:hypothetical protein n=1 Tax=Anaeromyxobacter sp. (strain K) TaxID=447217 RepID=UPI0002D6BF59|nr:hypothetical protein [Anaeromyxobacter sp. K]
MRLSRSRVLLRAALLLVGGAFMLVRAWQAWDGARTPGGDPVLLQRIALVEALVGVLALVAAGIALLSVRRRRRTHTLRLDDLDRR